MLPVAVHGLSGKLLFHSTNSTSPSGHIGIEVGCSKSQYVFAVNLMLVINRCTIRDKPCLQEPVRES